MTPTFAFVWLFTRGGTRFSRGGEIDTDLLKNSLQLHLSSMLLGTIMLLWAFDVHMSTSSYVYLIAGLPLLVIGIANIVAISARSVLAEVRADLSRVEDAIVRRRSGRSSGRSRSRARVER
ncbi:hypothetical protein T484DRAFT_1943291 [Baffinella frigidus]|nr:hypothetical protein T484DRAFT_1943291 [Cryptophyta sp. CCMP2293]